MTQEVTHILAHTYPTLPCTDILTSDETVHTCVFVSTREDCTHTHTHTHCSQQMKDYETVLHTHALTLAHIPDARTHTHTDTASGGNKCFSWKFPFISSTGQDEAEGKEGE